MGMCSSMSPMATAVASHTSRPVESVCAAGKPLDVAIVNGCDPVLLYAAQAKVPHGFDELTIAGGINGAPVEDAIAVLQLLKADIPARFPGVRLHIAHLAGDLAFLAQRIEDNDEDWKAFAPSPRQPDPPLPLFGLE